jgi:lysophospholipase L1-like esterase
MRMRTSTFALALIVASGCGDASEGAPGGGGGEAGGSVADGSATPDQGLGNDNHDAGATLEATTTSDDSGNTAHPSDASTDVGGEGATGPLEAIHYYGRWNLLPAMAVTVNSGSHVTATFHGTAVSARFDTSLNMDPIPNVTWQIDGGTWKEAEIAPTLSLATGLAAGTHDVRLMVRGLNENQSRWTPPLVSSITFLSFDVTGGAIDPSPRPIKRKIEFLGDSITEGVNTHKAAEIPKDTPTWRADGRLDYSCQTALALDAEWRQVGFGRQGLTVGGNGGVPVAQDAFNFFYLNVPRNAWQADVVVINQGTNDGGATSQTFRPLYATFLDRIRTAYPMAQIEALRPFNGAHADDIKNDVMARMTAGDTKVFYVDTTGWIDAAADTTDGLHPNPQGHAKVAIRLAAELKNHM